VTGLVPRPHTVARPPLLEQPRAAAAGRHSREGLVCGYESRPVVDVDAMDALTIIERGARFWTERSSQTSGRT